MRKNVILVFLVLLVLCFSACAHKHNNVDSKETTNAENIASDSGIPDNIKKDQSVKPPEIIEPEEITEEPSPEYDFGF